MTHIETTSSIEVGELWGAQFRKHEPDRTGSLTQPSTLTELEQPPKSTGGQAQLSSHSFGMTARESLRSKMAIPFVAFVASLAPLRAQDLKASMEPTPARSVYQGASTQGLDLLLQKYPDLVERIDRAVDAAQKPNSPLSKAIEDFKKKHEPEIAARNGRHRHFNKGALEKLAFVLEVDQSPAKAPVAFAASLTEKKVTTNTKLTLRDPYLKRQQETLDRIVATVRGLLARNEEVHNEKGLAPLCGLYERLDLLEISQGAIALGSGDTRVLSAASVAPSIKAIAKFLRECEEGSLFDHLSPTQLTEAKELHVTLQGLWRDIILHRDAITLLFARRPTGAHTAATHTSENATAANRLSAGGSGLLSTAENLLCDLRTEIEAAYGFIPDDFPTYSMTPSRAGSAIIEAATFFSRFSLVNEQMQVHRSKDSWAISYLMSASGSKTVHAALHADYVPDRTGSKS